MHTGFIPMPEVFLMDNIRNGEITGSVRLSSSISGSSVLKMPIQGAMKIGVKTVKELAFMPFSEFPENGNPSILYIDTSGGKAYYWKDAMYHSISGGAIIAKTTAEWNDSPGIMSELGSIYIYTDYRYEDETPIPAMKIGDGRAYVQDLPFFNTGITEADRNFWNNKVSASIFEIDPENLVLHTD